jgi:hypothetical protein
MSIFSNIKDKISAYIDVHVQLAKLSVMSGAAKLLSYVMFSLICMFILFVIITFMGLGISEAFVEMGMAKVGAHFATMGVFVLMLLAAIGLSKNITSFFAGLFIRVLTEKRNDDDDDDETSKK